MNDEHDKALLVDIAERQKAIQVELADLVKAHTQALEQYAVSDKVYRKQLDENQATHTRALEQHALSETAYRKQLDAYQVQLENYHAGRKIAMFIRLIALLLLLFIAYRLY